MTRFKALLVGLGQIGTGYDADLSFVLDQPRSSARTLTHARALACHQGFSLEAGIDPSPEARDRFNQIYNTPAYADLLSWLASSPDPSPDLVVIAVPPHQQPALVANLLDLTKPRLLLLEKPLAACLEQAKLLQAVCDSHPQMSVGVNYIRRWLPVVQAWRRRIQAGELGRFLHGHLTYGKGLLSNGSHFVNLAEAWLGPLVLGSRIDRGNSCLGFDCEASLELLAADHAHAPLQVRSIGAAGLRAGELDLWFEGGRICWPDHGRAISFWPRCQPACGDTHAPLSPDPDLYSTGLDHYQLEVVEALHRNLRDPTTFPLPCVQGDALRTLQTLAPAIADDC
jgi:predicted dehydrogenase